LIYTEATKNEATKNEATKNEAESWQDKLKLKSQLKQVTLFLT